MFVYALKWTLENTFLQYEARWVVHEFMEIPEVHYDPMAVAFLGGPNARLSS